MFFLSFFKSQPILHSLHLHETSVKCCLWPAGWHAKQRWFTAIGDKLPGRISYFQLNPCSSSHSDHCTEKMTGQQHDTLYKARLASESTWQKHAADEKAAAAFPYIKVCSEAAGTASSAVVHCDRLFIKQTKSHSYTQPLLHSAEHHEWYLLNSCNVKASTGACFSIQNQTLSVCL